MNKYEKAFETIGIHKVNLTKYIDLMKSLDLDPIIKINDLIYDDLPNEIKVIKEAFAKAELYDAQQNKTEDYKPKVKEEVKDINKHSNKCPICGSLDTYIEGNLIFAVNQEPYLDIDGNLCRNTAGGTSTIKCLKCGMKWNENLRPKKVIIKANPKAAKKK